MDRLDSWYKRLMQKISECGGLVLELPGSGTELQSFKTKADIAFEAVLAQEAQELRSSHEHVSKRAVLPHKILGIAHNNSEKTRRPSEAIQADFSRTRTRRKAMQLASTECSRPGRLPDKKHCLDMQRMAKNDLQIVSWKVIIDKMTVRLLYLLRRWLKG